MSEETPRTMTSAVKDRLVYGFNTFYGDLLSMIAKSDTILKKRLKKHYRVLNRKSDSYLLDFWKSAKEHDTFRFIFEDDGWDHDAVKNLTVCRGLRYSELSDGFRPMTRMLCAFAWMFGELCDASEEEGEEAVIAVNEMFEKFMEAVVSVQSGLSWGKYVDEIVDEDAKSVMKSSLVLLVEAKEGGSDIPAAAAASGPGVDDITEAFDMMGNSKLGSIVQEISKTIDKDKLKAAVENGQGINGEGNMELMGDLFKQVSGAITSKLQSGELNNEDLIQETMSLMNSVKGLM